MVTLGEVAQTPNGLQYSEVDELQVKTCGTVSADHEENGKEPRSHYTALACSL